MPGISGLPQITLSMICLLGAACTSVDMDATHSSRERTPAIEPPTLVPVIADDPTGIGQDADYHTLLDQYPGLEDLEAYGFNVVLGRPIGLFLRRDTDNWDNCIPEVQILVDVPFATNAYGPATWPSSVMPTVRVRLESRPRLDLAGLNDSNASAMLNSFLPKGIELGKPCVLSTRSDPVWNIKYPDDFSSAGSPDTVRAFVLGHLDLVVRFHSEAQRLANDSLKERDGCLRRMHRFELLQSDPRYLDDEESQNSFQRAIERCRKDHDMVVNRAKGTFTCSLHGLNEAISVIGEDAAEAHDLRVLRERAQAGLALVENTQLLARDHEQKPQQDEQAVNQDFPQLHQVFVGRIAGIGFHGSFRNAQHKATSIHFLVDDAILTYGSSIPGARREMYSKFDIPTIKVEIQRTPNFTDTNETTWATAIDGILPDGVSLGSRCLVHSWGRPNRYGQPFVEIVPYNSEDDRRAFLNAQRGTLTRWMDASQTPKEPKLTLDHYHEMKRALDDVPADDIIAHSKLESELELYVKSWDMSRQIARHTALAQLEQLERWRTLFDDDDWQHSIDEWMETAKRNLEEATQREWLGTTGTGDDDPMWKRHD